MKAVILAGGRGSRIAEESAIRPKPMISIGSQPILWHIMQIYAEHGVTDFVICLGYKGYVIKEYFANLLLHLADVVEFDLSINATKYDHASPTNWRVTLVETGEATQTGGRIKRVGPWVENEDAFCLTYGDGVANVDVSALIDFHRGHGKLATLTAVSPPGRFGSVELTNGQVTDFSEKPATGDQWINGGFFVLSPKILDYIEGDQTIWERDPLQSLAAAGELKAFEHRGFWQPMDTLRERDILEEHCATGHPPWFKSTLA
jgi:glucose-1-phosphate cytidylyltransferase